ncbi:hypothetical protein EV586_103640 [Tumebacillus sp. BK434]|uniref:ribonuclease H-like domain-containing protein n=1 Tax=Tumebacillus sp. BK434 TaxID=2512169 RepID=UPI001042FD2B|nr:ribonuclease H-like domain-containing protein [Tumebacillus sp. BK434]TCP55981.1 hypothetical protein EV586_103640 [Tumebacillus sp. BK434]
MRSLRDRLKSYKKDLALGDAEVKLEQMVQEAEALTDELPETAVERALPGVEQATPYGMCYYRDVRFDVLSLHGHYPLARTRHLPLSVLYGVCKIKDGPADWGKVCFFDTETTGLGSGAGNFIFLFGIGFYEDDELIVRQYFLRNYAEERAVLHALSELLQRFEVMVSFNGKGFDWKLLETRFTLARLQLAPVLHLDLLPPARRLWKKVLKNCKLITLEQEVLGFAREDDTPGKMAPELYFAYQTDGDARPLTGIFTHNVHDILTLATLSAHIGLLVEQPLQMASHPEELFGLSRWYDEWEKSDSSVACLVKVSRMEEQDYASEALWKLSLFYKRRGQYDKAVLLWHDLLDGSGMWQTAPRIELAKYYEHKARDYARALQLTNETLEVVQSRRAALRSVRLDHELHELSYRRQRLLKKCGGGVARGELGL